MKNIARPLAMMLALLPALASAKSLGVQRVAPGQYVIERSYLDRAMKDLTPVLQQARAVPHFEEGTMVGFRLMQIVPGSIYQNLGLKDGDVVLSINGNSLESPAKAIQVFGALRGASHVSVRLRRKAKVFHYVYDVRK
ncbi:MAG TPA: PDZ domain-containing protein [Bdellovibrionota bacterium]|nr:PDZ domain-containing protein [Bdellovibrionota bacterium]